VSDFGINLLRVLFVSIFIARQLPAKLHPPNSVEAITENAGLRLAFFRANFTRDTW
jgi:hypothetical protein